MKKLVIIALVILVAISATINGVLAAVSDTVSVTATPAYISISVSPDTWTLNGITGSAVIEPSTTYYSNPLGDTSAPANPVVDGACTFTLTNTSTVSTDIVANWSDFTGAGDTMANSNSGSPAAATYGAASYVSGAAWPGGKVTVQSAASADMINNLGATTNKKFGFQIYTRTNIWTAANVMSGTITVTASLH